MVCDAEIKGTAIASHRLLLKEVVTTSKISIKIPLSFPYFLLMSAALQMRRGAG